MPQILPVIEQAQDVVFTIVGFLMKLAPLAVLGATAHLVGEYGLGAMSTYGKLIAVCYGVALVFLLLLGCALKAVTGLSLWKFVRYTREELLLALGTGSSETVMPRMMQKLRAAGCRDDAVGLVLPTGYSFNLDGASIYLSIGTLFIAQAIGVDLSLGQQITVVLVLMLTSKGMAGVPGSAFLALSATASALGVIPAAAVALLLGVDRIMDSMRVATNLLGNCVAVFAVSRWEGALDRVTAKKVLNGELPAAAQPDGPAEQERAAEPGDGGCGEAAGGGGRARRRLRHRPRHLTRRARRAHSRPPGPRAPGLLLLRLLRIHPRPRLLPQPAGEVGDLLRGAVRLDREMAQRHRRGPGRRVVDVEVRYEAEPHALHQPEEQHVVHAAVPAGRVGVLLPEPVVPLRVLGEVAPLVVALVRLQVDPLAGSPRRRPWCRRGC